MRQHKRLQEVVGVEEVEEVEVLPHGLLLQESPLPAQSAHPQKLPNHTTFSVTLTTLTFTYLAPHITIRPPTRLWQVS